MKEVNVQVDYHRYIIGQRGVSVREMMDKHDVNISIPAAADGSDVILITGAPNNVAKAHKTLMKKVKELDAEQEDRVITFLSSLIIVSSDENFLEFFISSAKAFFPILFNSYRAGDWFLM